MSPQLCYTLRLFLFYNTTDDHFVITSFDFDTGQDDERALILRYEYAVGTTHKCFYDTKNWALVLWSIAQSKGFWAASGIFAFFAWIGCCVSGSVTVEDQLDGRDNLRVVWHIINIWFWSGFVIGMILFLPLGLSSQIPEPARDRLLLAAIIWTSVWTGLAVIAILYIYSPNLPSCLSCANVKKSFDDKWNRFHTWGRENVDERIADCVRMSPTPSGPPSSPPPPEYTPPEPQERQPSETGDALEGIVVAPAGLPKLDSCPPPPPFGV